MAERLGQHFLANPETARRIAGLVSPVPGEKILEIGPGSGALTEFLTGLGAEVTGIELDRVLADFLEKRFGDTLNVVNADFLSVSLADYAPDKICGNIPYQITGRILEKIMISKHAWKKAVLMIPLTVAARVTASPGDSDYSAVSVLCRAGGASRFEFKVLPDEFDPPPAIDSAVISIERQREPQLPGFYKLVRGAFSRRRKKIRNSLSIYFALPVSSVSELLDAAGINPAARPQELSVEDYQRLTAEFVKLSLL